MSDISITEAKTEIERGLRMFKAFEHADKVLGALVVAESRKGELERDIASLTKQRDDLKAAVTAETEDYAQRIATAEEATVRAELHAKEAGTQTIARADAKAGQIILKAEEKAAEAEARATAAQETFNHLTEQATAKAAELADIEAKIDKARATARRLLGE